MADDEKLGPPRGKVVIRTEVIPARFFRRLIGAPEMVVHEAQLSLSAGETYTLQQLLSPDVLPGIGKERYVTLRGDLSSCTVATNGDIVEIGPTGKARATHIAVVDLAKALLGERNDIVLDVVSLVTVIAPNPMQGGLGDVMGLANPTPMSGQIPLGRLKSVVVRGAPQKRD